MLQKEKRKLFQKGIQIKKYKNPDIDLVLG